MSRNGKADAAPAGGWLDGAQQRAWLAYIRVCPVVGTVAGGTVSGPRRGFTGCPGW